MDYLGDRAMTTTVEAIYENGVLRPVQAIPVAEGSRVEVIVIDPTNRAPKQVAERMARIAST